MKRILLMVLLTAFAAVPAHAGVIASGTFTLDAPVPCALACPYWISIDGNEAACEREPLAVPGSWDEYRVVAPDTATILVGGIRPELDYDLFLCRVHDPGTPDERYEYVATPNLLIRPCRYEAVWLGCEEWIEAIVEPGATYVLRGYNWSDIASADGEWWFCDTPQGCPWGPRR